MRLFVVDPRLRRFEEAAGELGSPGAPFQTRKAVWAQSDTQIEVARRILAEAGMGVPVLPSCPWHEAEGYHQHHIAEDKSYPESGEDDPWDSSDGPGTAWGL